MSEYKYILEPYKGMNTRYSCPGCNAKNKTFTRYIERETGEHIAAQVGRCNRENSCGYHYTPKQFFQDNNISSDTPIKKVYPRPKSVKKTVQKATSFMPIDVFKHSLASYDDNHFVKFLTGLFGTEITGQMISRYFIGTSNHWPGATIFWQIDTTGKIRTGKIMLYNPITGKRVKEPYNHIAWEHSALKRPEFELKQCLFGEHLLKAEPLKPVALCESEKTGIIASVYLPAFIWVAVGSLSNLNAEKCEALRGRNVTLYPNLNGFEKWSSKAKELSAIARFTVSDLLERKATEAERKQGLDIADYLMRFDYKQFSLKETFKREFLKPEPVPENEQLKVLQEYKNKGLSPIEVEQAINELINEHGFIMD